MPPVETPTTKTRTDRLAGLGEETEVIRKLVEATLAEPGRAARALGVGAWFLEDGRVLCLDRQQGDSRCPYGTDGFTLWVHASGRISANTGPYFLLLPSDDGQDPPAAAYVGFRRPSDRAYRSLSAAPLPLTGDEQLVRRRYSVIGFDATYFVVETDDIRSVVRVFLDQDDDGRSTIYWSQQIENLSAEALECYAAFYLNPFCRRQFYATSEDRWFKQIAVEKERVEGGRADDPTSASRPTTGQPGLPDFCIQTNEDVSRFESRTNRSRVRRAVRVTGPPGTWGSGPNSGLRFDPAHRIECEQTTSWRRFVGGARRSLGNAAFLRTGKLVDAVEVTAFDENAVVGDLCRVALPAGGSCETHHAWLCTGHDSDPPRTVLSPTEVAAAAERARQRTADGGQTRLRLKGAPTSRLNAETLNRFVPFLQRQVAVCAQVRGYMQTTPNSLIGFRDVLQALEGWLYDDPMTARTELLRVLEFVFPDGRCPRQYLLPAEDGSAVGDLREFVDQGAWAVAAIHSYVRVTGDWGLLNEELGYHEPDPSSERLLRRHPLRNSVLHHLVAIVDYLARCRDPASGLVRMLYGDWNDAIDGLGLARDGRAEFGDGVSVMASLQFYKACEEAIELVKAIAPPDASELLRRFGGYRKETSEALLAHAVVSRNGERRLLHGWGDRREFTVGGFDDVDGVARDGLTSNAFWVLSGMLNADPTVRHDILAAFDRLDSRFGLKTFNPGFGPAAAVVGRISKLPVGSAENGAVYVHATAFAIAALFQMGEPRRAWEQIEKILPFTEHHGGLTHSPFVLPNSYVDNPSLNLNGQSMNDWQTGSSNVLWKILVRQVAGFDPQFGVLRVTPANWAPFESFSFESRAHGVAVRISWRRGAAAEREFRVNGSKRDATGTDPISGLPFFEISYNALARDETNDLQIIDP